MSITHGFDHVNIFFFANDFITFFLYVKTSLPIFANIVYSLACVQQVHLLTCEKPDTIHNSCIGISLCQLLFLLPSVQRVCISLSQFTFDTTDVMSKYGVYMETCSCSCKKAVKTGDKIFIQERVEMLQFISACFAYIKTCTSVPPFQIAPNQAPKCIFY